MQTKQFDQYDITELMGLVLTPKQKAELLKEYYTLILNHFFTQDFSNDLPPSNQAQVLDVLSSDKPDVEKLALINEFIPTLGEKLEVFTQEEKKRLLKEHYASMLKECENMYSSNLTPENKALLSRKYDRYAQALNLLSRELWNDLHLHMNNSSPQIV